MSYYPLISIMPKAQPLLLDLYPSAAAAYSLRKIRNGYTGSAIQVRRESDDATQNIAFDLLGELDTSTLLNFVGWNLFAWSEQLQQFFWGKSNLTVTTDILVAPDGNTTGDVLFETVTNAAHTFQRNQALVSGKTYTVSFWIKAQGRNNVRLVTSFEFSQSASNAIAWLDLSLGTIVSQNSGFTGSNLTITADGSWYKVSYTMPATNTGNVLVLALNPSPNGTTTSYIGNPLLGIAVWGLQFTESSTIKPYRQTLAIAEGNGFVTTWYDQSTNGVNATQPTALYQPRIVNLGVLDVVNGKPAVLADGVDDNLTNTTLSLTNPTSIFTVVDKVGNSGNFGLFDSGFGLSGAFLLSGTGIYFYQNGPSFSPQYTNNNQSLLVAKTATTGTNWELYGNNTNVTNGGQNIGTQIGTVINLFTRSAGNLQANMYMQEFIVWGNNQMTNRINIQNNMNSFYTIY